MGRKRLFRQNLIEQTKGVAIKNPLNWLIHLTMNQYGLSPRESELLALKAYRYLNSKKEGRSFEQIQFSILDGRNSHSRKHTRQLKEVTLTPYCFTDLEVLEEFGLVVMQNARIYRLIEEAYAQDAIFPLKSLSFLTGLAKDALQKRLVPLWKEGIRLPISGMSKQWRNNFQTYRCTKALTYLATGMKLRDIRKKLALSRDELARYRSEIETVAQSGVDAFSEHLPGLKLEYATLVDHFRYEQQQCSTENKGGNFYTVLIEEHSFSPAKARDYLDTLHEFLMEEFNEKRKNNTIIYFAISEEEPAGKAIKDCNLIPVTLEYYTSKEFHQYNGKKVRRLEWERILRYTTQARQAGGLLTQADLSFLMGVNTGVIQRLLKENPTVIVPTRGQIVDIGCGLTHVEKVIKLFLDNYTETQIAERSGHSLVSIENYLRTFASVVVLADKGMPTSMIRKSIGRSRKLVENHIQIYEEYKNLPDAQFALMQLKNSFINRNDNRFFKWYYLKGGDPAMHKKTNPYKSFVERTLDNVQQYELKEQFDFSKESWLARKLSNTFNAAMDTAEQKNGVQRLQTGDLLTLHHANQVVLPLLDHDILASLANDGIWSKHKPLLEDIRLNALRCYDSKASREDLYRLTNIRGLVFNRGPKDKKNTKQSNSWTLVKPEDVGEHIAHRILEREEVTIPNEVYNHMMARMEEEGCISKERARAIIEELAYCRALYYPLKSELQVGQVVWNGIAISDRQQKERNTCYRKQVPLILTLQTEEEMNCHPLSLSEVNTIQKNQIARLCVEAYLQGVALTLTDLNLLTFRSISAVSHLVNEYMSENQVILPTAGTVKDAGRATTHKHLVINLHVSGLFTTEIARKTFHSEEAIDRYLDLFYAILILYLYDVPVYLMARVTGRGQMLIKEHLELVHQHFPNKTAIKKYLKKHGVDIA